MFARYLPLLIGVVLTYATEAHAARVLDRYDVDSLCAMATLIVKAEVGEATDVQTRDGDCAVWDVTILSTLHGDAKPHSVIRVAGIEEYRKGPGIVAARRSYQRLSKGAIVYLFLVPKDAHGGYAKYRLTDADWKVIESGARLVMKNDVYGFAQYFPPAPSAGPVPGFVAMTEAFPGAPVASVEAFEKQVQVSLRYVAELRRKLSANSLTDAEKQEILRTRREVLKRECAHSDYIPRLIVDEPRRPTTGPASERRSVRRHGSRRRPRSRTTRTVPPGRSSAVFGARRSFRDASSHLNSCSGTQAAGRGRRRQTAVQREQQETQCHNQNKTPSARATYLPKEEAGMSFPPDRTALLVIDPVNDFLSEGGAGWELTKTTVTKNDVVGHLKRAIEGARACGIPILFGPMAYTEEDYASVANAASSSPSGTAATPNRNARRFTAERVESSSC